MCEKKYKQKTAHQLRRRWFKYIHPKQLLQNKFSQLSCTNWKLCQRNFNHQEIIMCDKIIKLANLQIKGRIEQQTRVYSTKGISPTLNSAMGHGGNCIPLFLIVKEI